MLHKLLPLLIAGCAVLGIAEAEETKASFTGRVNSTRVRLRTAAKLDAPIIRELEKQELVVVTGEEDEFYAVQPPADVVGYVYRTYVLDGAIEGTHVNVRLAPALEAPVLTQLNTGDKVDGTPCEENSKWMKITLPETTRLYVSKDYVENIGPTTLISQLAEGKEMAEKKLVDTLIAVQTEMRKPFEEIRANVISGAFTGTDFGSLQTAAQDAKSIVDEVYLQRKIAYLEAKANAKTSDKWQTYEVDTANAVRSLENRLDAVIATLPAGLQTDIQTQLAGLEPLEALEAPVATSEIAREEFMSEPAPSLVITQEIVRNTFSDPDTTPVAVAPSEQGSWIPAELSVYDRWATLHPSKTLADMYDDEQLSGTKLKGVLQAYTGPVKNKPGDYLLINPVSKLPIAYLYSTQVNLNSQVGRLVTVVGAQRPNHNFAFPAFHVLMVE